MPTTELHESDAARGGEGRRPSRRRHGWLAVALAGLALLIVPAAAMAETAVVGWGKQEVVGLGPETVQFVPPATLPGVQDATAAAVGPSTSYVLTPGGVLSSAGGTFSLIPATAGAKAVATGDGIYGSEQSTLIVKGDGTVDGFGGNTFGEAGGTPGVPIAGPTPIAGLSNVTAVATGQAMSVALEADGSVWAWGHAPYLGSEAAAAGADTGTPTQVTLPAGNPATAIAAGASHVLILLQDGSVWAWGLNEVGQVGDGSRANVTVPVQVIPPAAPGDPKVTAVSAGGESSFALYSDGTYKAWGGGYWGPLGLGRSPEEEEAVVVPTSPDPAAVSAHPAAYPPLQQIVSTAGTTYAIVAGSGQVLVWGDNGNYLAPGAFGFGENPPTYTYAYPYDPADPDVPGSSGQGGTEIPQRLGRLKDVPWLGVGPTATSEIVSTATVLVPLLANSSPGFFEHPVGTVSAPQIETFGSIGEPTEVTSIGITGPDAADFSIVGTSFDLVGPGSFLPVPLTLSSLPLVILVRFNPSGPGDREASLQISGQDETASIRVTGYGTELPGNTPGPQGPAGVGLVGPAGANGKDGASGLPGAVGPVGKNGVVVFAASRPKVSARRGSTASLGFLLVNGTTAKLAGTTVSASVPKTLGTSVAGGPTKVAPLAAGGSRQVKIPLRIAADAKLGTQQVKVAFRAGGKTVTRKVRVQVTG
jgi:Regulator of chromosome condensation (RCC1) repeat